MTPIRKDKPYHELQKTYALHPLGAPPSETFIEILKFYFDPEEAGLAATMGFEPEPEEAIAKRAGMTVDEAAPLLTRMSSRFFIRGFRRPDGVRTFCLNLIHHGSGLLEMPFVLRESSMDLVRLGDLWHKYYREALGRSEYSSGISITRAMPSLAAVKESILPYEDALQVVQKAPFLSLNPCTCRQAFRVCDDPIEVCIGLSMAQPAGQPGEEALGTPLLDNEHALTVASRSASVDEVVDVLRRAEEEGLVHVCMNQKEDPWFICNCCRHACTLLRGVTELGFERAVAPSGYWTIVDEDMCTGCELCVERCPMSAIRMREDSVAEVKHEKCLGCGICAFVCGAGALTLEKRDDFVFTPFEDDRELFMLIAEKKGVPYPARRHHR